MFEIMETLSKKNKYKPYKNQTVWMREYNADTQTLRELFTPFLIQNAHFPEENRR
jgi:hypothetical protein